jgi:hypothetical protein
MAFCACRTIPNVPAVTPTGTLGPAPSLAGNWQLILRDTRRGRRAFGALVLQPTAHRDTFAVYPANERSREFSVVPYEGYARIDLSAAGAVTALDPGSTNPTSPGAVLRVDLSRSGESLDRRAELVPGGTRRDGVVKTDGPSLEMLIWRWISDSLVGTWESTECACAPRAAGYFLARRER